MKNWLAQDIEVGSVVGRGARAGNTSDFKIGVVTKVTPDKLKATVEWKYEYTNVYHWYETGRIYATGWNAGKPILEREFWGYAPHKMESKGHPGVESLFVLDEEVLDRAARYNELLVEKAKRSENGVPMIKAEWDERVAAL